MSQRIIRINASGLKQSTCMRRFYRLIIDGYKKQLSSNVIEFGSAGHVFNKTLYTSKGDLLTSLNAAREYWLTTPMEIENQKKYLDEVKLVTTCMDYYTSQFPQDIEKFDVYEADGKPAVELTFSNVFYEDASYKILFEGTIDRVGKYKRGCNMIRDYKYTSQDPKYYFDQYELSCQLRFYLYNLKFYAHKNPDSFIAELFKGGDVGCQIDGIFLSSSLPAQFKSSRIFFFKEDDMHQFYLMLNGFVARTIDFLNRQMIPYKEGILNGACGGGFKECVFAKACAAPDEVAETHVLRNNFIQREYKPIERD